MLCCLALSGRLLMQSLRNRYAIIETTFKLQEILSYYHAYTKDPNGVNQHNDWPAPSKFFLSRIGEVVSNPMVIVLPITQELPQTAP